MYTLILIFTFGGGSTSQAIKGYESYTECSQVGDGVKNQYQGVNVSHVEYVCVKSPK